MYILDTHRPVVQRVRLAALSELGAGNFFWHTCALAPDLDRPLLFHPNVADPEWKSAELPAHTLRSMRSTVIRYADWYRRRGISEQCRVGVYTRDGLLTLLHHIALTSIGAVAVHVNPNMAPGSAAEYFQRTQISALVGDTDLTAQVSSAAPQVTGSDARPLVVDVQSLDMEATPPPGPLPDFPYRHSDAELIMLCHSSGTTGRPKATMFTHRSFFIGKRERLFTFPSRRSDRMLSVLPHSHSAGISYLMLALLLQLPTLVLDESGGAAVATAMNRFRPTVVLGFPSTLAGIPLSALSPPATRAVHTWIGMGDASHESHIRPLLRVGRRPVRGGWQEGSRYLDGLGSSEMGMVLFSRVHTLGTSTYGRAIGRPARVVRDAAALDDRGRKLPAGEAGALGVRTPSATPGYWDDPDLNTRSLRRGYFLTGDVVRQGADGQWYHLDRVPDVIQSASGPVYSLPLEEVVLLATGAFDAAVIGVDDPRTPGTSCPVAVVLFQEDGYPEPGRLLPACNDALRQAGLTTLRAFVVAAGRHDLPVGVTGKVRKVELRRRHRTLLSDPPSPGVAVAPPGAAEPETEATVSAGSAPAVASGACPRPR
jgi:long-chain acyl-CoA synthetase